MKTNKVPAPQLPRPRGESAAYRQKAISCSLMQASVQRALLILMAIVLGGIGPAKAAIFVHTTDFIANATRTAYNGFESIPNNGAWYNGLPISGNGSYGPYTEDGITVQQVLPQGYMNQGGVLVNTFHPEGLHGWYASDFGYTTIRLSDGSDFANVGLTFGSGFTRVSPTHTYYSLLKDGQVVLSGYVYFLSDPANTGDLSNSAYLGFSGGGFDEIWLRNCNGPTHFDYTLWKNVLDVQTGDPFAAGNLSSFNTALAIDGIEVSGVPEPATWSLLASGGLAALIRVSRGPRRDRRIPGSSQQANGNSPN